MIKDSAYWMGRDVKYASELTGEIEENAKELIGRVNNLLASLLMGEREVRSGWRPQGVNDATKNAAASSKHITGQAVDLADNDRSLAKAIMLDPEALETFGLWMEDTRWTPTWVHLQSVPPKSGKRIYIPNASPPIAPPVIA
jgi:hypothetical protein